MKPGTYYLTEKFREEAIAAVISGNPAHHPLIGWTSLHMRVAFGAIIAVEVIAVHLNSGNTSLPCDCTIGDIKWDEDRLHQLRQILGDKMLNIHVQEFKKQAWAYPKNFFEELDRQHRSQALSVSLDFEGFEF